MISIKQIDFLKMLKIGILNGKDRNKKNWVRTSKTKKSKRKKYFITDNDFRMYQNYLRNELKNTKRKV